MKDNRYRSLMLAIFATQIKDYFNGILANILTKKKSGETKERALKSLHGHAYHAREWIKNRDGIYIFSFVSICKHLDVDPAKMRRRIFAIKTPDQVHKALEKRDEMIPFGQRPINPKMQWKRKKEKV